MNTEVVRTPFLLLKRTVIPPVVIFISMPQRARAVVVSSRGSIIEIS
jgi:hypothetical protein